MPGCFIIFVAAIIITVIIFSAISASKRRQALLQFAASRGLQYSSDGELRSIYEIFRPFNEGHSRRVSNVISGECDGLRWEILDYSYKTGSGKDETTHTVGAVFAYVSLAFEPLQMRPENLFDKMKGLLGFEDINFESEEFSRAYFVACKDRKFAYDLLHPQMIEYLLALPKFDWQFAGNMILIHKSGTYDTTEIPAIMSAIEGFLQRVPGYVRQDIGLNM